MSLLRVIGSHHFFESPASDMGDQLTCMALQKIISVFVLSLLAYGVGFLTSYVLLLYFSPDFYGDVMLAQQVLIVASTVLLMGTKNLTKRFMTRYMTSGQKDFAHYFWWHASYLCQAMLLFAILYSSSVYALVYIDRMNLISLSHFHIAFWTMVVSPFYALFLIFRVYLLVFGYVMLYDFCSLVLANMMLILLSLAWSVWFPLPGLWDRVSLLVTQSFCLFVILCLLVFFLLSGPLRKVLQFNHVIQVESEWSCHPISALMTDLYSSLPIFFLFFIVEVFAHSESVLGDFSLCIVISSVLSGLSQFLYPLAYASIRQLMVTDQIHKYRQLLLQLNRSVFCLSLLILLILFCFGHSILAVFGRDSETTYWMLLGLSLATWLMGLYYYLMNIVMVAKGLTSFVSLMDFSFYFCLVFFGSLVVYFYGVIGFVVFYIGLIACQLLVSVCKFHSVSGYHVLVLW